MRRDVSNGAVKAGNSVRRHGPRGLGACRRGAVALEFALASTPLLLIVFGFIALSSVFNTWSSMQSNAQYAARMVSTGTITASSAGTINNNTLSASCPNSTSTQVEYYACTGLPAWTTYTVKTVENCTVPSVTVSLTANAHTMAIADIMNIFSSTSPIVASAVVMKEGTCP
jgi:Flp pilus assembly protein TadG